MRVVRGGDWVPSVWTDSVSVTAQPQGAEVVFASNWLQQIVAVNREPEYTWPQPNNDRVLQLSGRDYQIVFQEAEERGTGDDGFEFEVTVYTPDNDDPDETNPAGQAVFDPLRDFLRTYAPYIAIKDWNGSIWYGRATVDEENTVYLDDGAAMSHATVRVVETQAEATPVAIPTIGS
jgi:hypothetical protein